MNQTDPVYQRYLQILREELQPAFGCTEPAALAYAAALASDLLGMLPERMEICCSGNIIKNVKSVIVPNAGGGKGLQLAAAAGVIAGHPERKLELLSSLTDADYEYVITRRLQPSKALVLTDLVCSDMMSDSSPVH